MGVLTMGSLEFVLDENDDPETQALLFCASTVAEEQIDRCSQEVLEQVYKQRPDLRPQYDQDDANEQGGAEEDYGDDEDNVSPPEYASGGDTTEQQLYFQLGPEEDPHEAARAFCEQKVLPKDID